MSLIAWYPFVNDINNYGESELIPTAGTFTLSANGKIGTNCASGAVVCHLQEDIFANNTFSFACWAKASAWSPYNNILFSKNTNASNDCQIYFSVINGTSLTLAINGDTGSTCSCGINIPANEWHHYAFTYDGINYAVYFDGECKRSGICTNAYRQALNIGLFTRSLDIAGTNVYTSSQQIFYNDVRIYDEGISKLVVLRLAEGLVLDYSFNDAELEPTTNLVASADCTFGNLTHAEFTSTYANNKWSITGTGYNPRCNFGTFRMRLPVAALKPNTTQSISFKLKEITGAITFGDWCDIGFISTSKKAINDYYLCSCQVTNTNYDLTYNFLDFSSSENFSCEIWDIQLEDKDHATVYTTGIRGENLLTGTLGAGGRCTISGNSATINWVANNGDTYFLLQFKQRMTTGAKYLLTYNVSGLGSTTVTFALGNKNEYTMMLVNGQNNYRFTCGQDLISSMGSGALSLLFDDKNRDATLSNLVLSDFKLVEVTAVQDDSGYNNNGILQSGSLSNDTNIGLYSLNFNGSSDYLTCSNNINSLFTGGSNPFTVTFNFKNVAADRGIIFGDYNTAGTIGFNIEKTVTNYLRFFWDGVPDLVFTLCTLDLDTWVTCAIVYTGSAINIYKNGVFMQTHAVTLSTRNKTSGNFFIGKDARSGITMLEGKLSDFKIYATALSADTILTKYKAKQKIDRKGNLYSLINEGTTTTKFNKTGIVDCKRLVESYKTPDGVEWLPICVHNNNGGTNLFINSGDYTKPVYKNDECWCNFGAINGADHGTNYEFLVVQQAEIDGPFTSYRFSQTVNPMTATWNDVKPGSANVTYISGGPTVHGGIYYANYNHAKMVFANSTNGHWGGCGQCGSYQGGIPGYNMIVKGYQLIYLRVYSTNTKILRTNILETKELIEN